MREIKTAKHKNHTQLTARLMQFALGGRLIFEFILCKFDACVGTV